MAGDKIADDLEALRAHPADDKLREEVILLTRDRHPIVDDSSLKKAAETEGRAAYLFKHATGRDEMLQAAHLYELDSVLVPWDARYYFDAGLAYEQAGPLVAAMRCFHFYLLAAPNAQDALGVSEHIGEIQSKILSSMHPSGDVRGDYFENRVVATGKSVVVMQSFDCLGNCGQEGYTVIRCHDFVSGLEDCHSPYIQDGASWPSRFEWTPDLDKKVTRKIHLDTNGSGYSHTYFCSQPDAFDGAKFSMEIKIICKGDIYVPNL